MRGAGPGLEWVCPFAWASGSGRGLCSCLICPLCPPEPYETQQTKPMSFFPGLRLVMSHGPYIKLIAGFLFTSLAFMVSGALMCSA